MESERLWRKGSVKPISFKCGAKGRGSDRLCLQRWGLWWADVRPTYYGLHIGASLFLDKTRDAPEA